MFIKKISIKNFRCFKDFQTSFNCSNNHDKSCNKSVILITGENGTGKTSLFEAIHYICYMKSFRTANPKDMLAIQDGKVIDYSSNIKNDLNSINDVFQAATGNSTFAGESFFIKAEFCDNYGQDNELQVGFSKEKRLVKLNQKNINSFEQLFEAYRVITLTEDDMEIIKGGPEKRRDFLDHAIMLFDSTYIEKMREYRKILQNRNTLLQNCDQNYENKRMNKDVYDLWTEQLWNKSIVIQEIRENLLKKYEKTINNILGNIFGPVISEINGQTSAKTGEQIDSLQNMAINNSALSDNLDQISVSLEYTPRKIDLGESFDGFLARNKDLMNQEIRFGRSLFGPHLDDFLIKFQCKKSRNYASRGQQKLLVLMLKVAQILDLKEKRGSAIFLLDDFMTDFDPKRGEILLDFLISLNIQLIFTSPKEGGVFEQKLHQIGAHIISLPL